MKSILTQNSTIGTVIEHTIAVGEALFSLGINPLPQVDLSPERFYSNQNIQKNLVTSKVAYIDSFRTNQVNPSTSIQELIAHLVEVHRYLIKNKLPFIVHLIEETPISASWIKDLKLIFPLFVEDFIHHIFEEEETLFKYILQLNEPDTSLLTNPYSQQNISSHALEHLHEDELKGVRELTNNFILPTDSIKEKIILSALSDFDSFLAHHAKIEDTILFPKALQLENQFLSLVKKNSFLN
ncbi:MAG: hemerythrin domain-containing protein [Cyclobacteriaceae bacterium]